MSEQPQYGWVKRHGIPVLYFDPMPDLGPYINQRAWFGAYPRPVKWWPTNWLLLPIVWGFDVGAEISVILKGRKP